MTFRIGPFRLDLIRDGRFELPPDSFVNIGADGEIETRGSHVGQARVLVDFHSLVIRGNGRTIVVDPGTGTRDRDAVRRQYNMEWPRRFFAELARLDVEKSDVDLVILTHLHWDHCGGGVHLEGTKLLPAFPLARYVVQKAELTAARETVRGDDDGYDPTDFEPLSDAGVLDVISGDAEPLPGIMLALCGGHSRGLQIVTIHDGGKRAVYLSDLLPTPGQLDLQQAMSYDLLPDELRKKKEAVLTEAAKQDDLLFFVHALRNPAGRIREIINHQFEFTPAV